MRFCGCGSERGSAQDPPLRTLTGALTGALTGLLTGALTGAQKVLQQRRYFPAVCTRRKGGANAWAGVAKKNKKSLGLKKSWWVGLLSLLEGFKQKRKGNNVGA